MKGSSPERSGYIQVFMYLSNNHFDYMKIKNGPQVIRPLNDIEQAFTISNSFHPLSAVIILQIGNRPSAEALRNAIDIVQEKHVLLQAGITKEKGKYTFIRIAQGYKIALEVYPRSDSYSWQEIAEKSLNTSVSEQGPLLHVKYVIHPEATEAEIILTFHHAIIDASSARLILHELLSLLGNLTLPGLQNPSPVQSVRLVRPNKPYRSLFYFLAKQFKEEWAYRTAGLGRKPANHSENKIMHLRFNEDVTGKIVKACRQRGLNLNNLLLATITMATLEKKYPKTKSGLVRVINFVNIGQSLHPPIDPSALGCYISMLRLSINTSRENDIYSMASEIRKALRISRRTDTIKLMSWISKWLVRMTMKMKNDRMGVSALSFIGLLDLQPQYGAINLIDVHTYITNNQYGPEVSAFGKILHNQLGLDFNYLCAETSQEEAEEIITQVRKTLTSMLEIS